MQVKPGDKIPAAKFVTMGVEGPEAVDTDSLFKGRRVAVFAVPGAFTPTCSAQHLPGFRDNAQALAGKGIDAIACTSVNDVFVMDAWARDQNIDGEIIMLADGNGDFARAMGLELDGTGFGMGQRSQRYSMIVNDGVIEQLNVEDGGEFAVSSAEYMLDHL